MTKEVKDLDSKHCKILMEDVKEDTNKWKDIPCFLDRMGAVKISTPSKKSTD